MKKTLKVTSAVLAIALVVSGCNGSKKAGTSNLDEAFLKDLKTASYPIETNETLRWWSYRDGSGIGPFTDPAQMPYLVEYEKATGVDINWEFAVPGQELQQFNLLLASGDIPDIMGNYMATDLPGGADKCINDGLIASLNDLIDDYAPGFKKYLNENPELAKELKTDAGHYYYLPSYARTEEQGGAVTAGYMMRKDWLDELGLEIPETIDEWYTVLKAFKEKKGAESPFTINYTNFDRGFSGGFGISLGFYRDGDKIRYGYAEPGFKDFITTLNKWYNEGILDPSVATIDGNSINAKMINGDAGAAMGWLQGGMKVWTDSAREKNPKYELTAVPFPVTTKGETPTFGTRDPAVYFGGCAIGATSGKKELAMKVLDFGFTDKGMEQFAVGIEGVTYTIEDGVYKFTDLILNNSDGMTSGQASAAYIRNSENIPMCKDESTLRAKKVTSYALPEMEKAVTEIWERNDVIKTRLPNTLTPLASEESEYARIEADVSTYAVEMMLKFIVGEEPLSNYDKYMAELKNRGLDKMIKIKQAAFDRYLAR